MMDTDIIKAIHEIVKERSKTIGLRFPSLSQVTMVVQAIEDLNEVLKSLKEKHE